MNISRLYTRNSTPFAVLLQDKEEHYPVFLETLTNTVVCDALIESGWQLCGLPYDFRKDGRKLESLPTEEWNPSLDEEQEMWDLIGDALSQSELKERITESPDLFISMPTGQYTINTREEFLAYLYAVESTELLDDFLPINYFVHPSALFDYEEYVDISNSRYISIMENRRTMSLPKFEKMITWALHNGLKKDFEPIDLVEFYFQWGIDGLNLPVISKAREQRHIVLGAPQVTPDQVDSVVTREREIGLLTKGGEFIVPEQAQGKRWSPKDSDSVITEKRRDMAINEVIAVELQCKAPEEIIVLETLKCTIQFNTTRLMVGSKKQRTIAARSFERAGSFVHTRFWNPAKWDAMKEDMYLKSIADTLVDKLTVKADVSSYRALLESGCSPLSALQRIYTSLSLGEVDAINQEESVALDYEDLQVYLQDAFLPQERVDVIEAIMSGETNIDKTNLGARADMNADSSRYYKDFYAAYSVLGISPEDIHKQVMSVNKTTEVLEFGTDDQKLIIELKRIDNKFKNFKADKRAYKQQQAEEADELLYVTCVARELGSEKAKKHVAISTYCVVKDSTVKMMLDELGEIFQEEVRDNVIGDRMQAMYFGSTMVWACGAFFDFALKGITKFPDEMGGRVISCDPKKRVEYIRYLRENIEDTVSLCDTNTYVYDKKSYWRRYCVNAVITVDEVMPRKGYNIPETSFAAVWNDFSNRPEMLEKLVRLGHIPNRSFVCWDRRFYTNSLCEHELGVTGMDFYYENSENERRAYPKDKEFVAVTHPLFYRYPKLDDGSEEEVATINPPRDGAPLFRIGEARILTEESSKKLEELKDLEIKDAPGFKRFFGLDSDDFFFTKGNVSYPNNKRGQSTITITDATHFYTEEGGIKEFIEIENIDRDKYPVTNVRGRKYIICDSLGELWEVTI